MTGDAACRGIRDHDPDGSIGLVGEEPDPPYSRPPLSKALWQGKDEASIWRGTADLGVDLHLGREAVALDRAARTVTDSSGETYRYERLLLATGGTPRRLPGDTGSDVVYFRRLPDYRHLRALADAARRVRRARRRLHRLRARSGAQLDGLLGTDRRSPKTGSERGSSPPTWRSPSTSSTAVTASRCFRASASRPSSATATASPSGSRAGATLEADAVVAGLGIVPSDRARRVGRPRGRRRDRRRRVRARRRHRRRLCGRRRRAVPGGGARHRHAGRARGSGEQPRPCGRREHGRRRRALHATCRSSTPTCSSSATRPSARWTRGSAPSPEWSEPFRKGVVAYFDEAGRPRGFLLVDTWGKVDAATELIAAGEPLPARRAREPPGLTQSQSLKRDLADSTASSARSARMPPSERKRPPRESLRSSGGMRLRRQCVGRG